jgi:hypothetical protein
VVDSATTVSGNPTHSGYRDSAPKLQAYTLKQLVEKADFSHGNCQEPGGMNTESVYPLLLANVLLALAVAVPFLLVGAAIVRELLGAARRRRGIEWVELEGIGRIPVLKG